MSLIHSTRGTIWNEGVDPGRGGPGGLRWRVSVERGSTQANRLATGTSAVSPPPSTAMGPLCTVKGDLSGAGDVVTKGTVPALREFTDQCVIHIVTK